MFSEIEDRSWLGLQKGESIVWWSHPTILMYLPKIVPASLLLILSLIGLGAGVPSQIPYMAYIYLGASLGFTGYILYQLLHYRSVYYVVTDHRAIRKDGIISRKINPVNFSRVSNIKSDVSIPERVVSFIVPGQNIGDLFIHSADDELGDIEFRNVKEIKESMEAVQSQLSQHSNPVDE